MSRDSRRFVSPLDLIRSARITDPTSGHSTCLHSGIILEEQQEQQESILFLLREINHESVSLFPRSRDFPAPISEFDLGNILFDHVSRLKDFQQLKLLRSAAKNQETETGFSGRIQLQARGGRGAAPAAPLVAPARPPVLAAPHPSSPCSFCSDM